MTLRKLLSTTILSALLLLGFTSQTTAQTIFEAHLSGSNEVPVITSTASGSITAILTGSELTVEGSFDGLSSDYTGSHIHFGMAGQAGGVMVALSPTVGADNQSGMFEASSNTFTLTSGQIDTLMMQGLYINIHSEMHATGELRGQLAPEADAHFRANLSGAFEVPAAKTMASGAVILQMEGDSLFVSGSFSNLSSAFNTEIAGGSHIHIASAGSNGDVALLLNASVSDDMMSGIYLPDNNRFELTTEQKTALMHRMFYVNIHSTAFASGELRGQITPPVTASFYASLSGSAELPSVKTDASGALILELNGDSLFASGSFTGLDSDFDAEIAGGSHLHAGNAGMNGGVDFLLNADVDAGLRSGSYSVMNNMFELTADQKATLMARGYYVNLHTKEYGGGELRGQVLGDATAYFKTSLSGLNEILPVWTNAMGALNVEVTGTMAIVSGGFTGLSSNFDAEVAGGAHLHAGDIDANGNVEILLNTTVMSDTAGMYAPMMNMFTLTEAQKSILFEEGMYANIHTEGFGGGELRGQLLFAENSFPDSSEIISPVDGAMLMLTGAANTVFEATWSTSMDSDDNNLSYIWQLASDSAFTNLLVNTNVGADAMFTTDFGTLVDILASLDVAVGASVTVYHRVIVSDGSNHTMGTPSKAILERGTITANENNTENPVEFTLDQNYPNPFNPSTNISFSISEPGLVSLKVYNLLGQEVASLVNERLSSGSYDFNFDASQLSSGIYIYRLQSSGKSITKKMSLIK